MRARVPVRVGTYNKIFGNFNTPLSQPTVSYPSVVFVVAAETSSRRAHCRILRLRFKHRFIRGDHCKSIIDQKKPLIGLSSSTSKWGAGTCGLPSIDALCQKTGIWWPPIIFQKIACGQAFCSACTLSASIIQCIWRVVVYHVLKTVMGPCMHLHVYKYIVFLLRMLSYSSSTSHWCCTSPAVFNSKQEGVGVVLAHGVAMGGARGRGWSLAYLCHPGYRMHWTVANQVYPLHECMK